MNKINFQSFQIDRNNNELSILKELKNLINIQSNLIQICLNSKEQNTKVIQNKLKVVQALTQSQSLLIQNYILDTSKRDRDDEFPF